MVVVVMTGMRGRSCEYSDGGGGVTMMLRYKENIKRERKQSKDKKSPAT